MANLVLNGIILSEFTLFAQSTFNIKGFIFMKKWLIGSFIILVLLFLAVSYLFIPQKIFISKAIISNSNDAGVFRFLSNKNNWQKWWPGKAINNTLGPIQEFKGYHFKLDGIQYNALRILIEKNEHTDSSLLYLQPIGADSVNIVWSLSLHTGNNPFYKIDRYFKAKNLRNNLTEILTALQPFISDARSIYGLDIKKEKVKVEFLVSTRKVYPHYPETNEIYEMINEIKSYISKHQASEDDYPMLNIKAVDSANFEAQVGIPVNKEVPSTDRLFLKQMLKNGDILTAEVKGGKNTCDSAMKKVGLFVKDHRFLSVALPFQSLITDRTKEKDTSNWVTKIYYPVVY
jgi:hypothetical protein